MTADLTLDFKPKFQVNSKMAISDEMAVEIRQPKGDNMHITIRPRLVIRQVFGGMGGGVGGLRQLAHVHCCPEAQVLYCLFVRA